MQPSGAVGGEPFKVQPRIAVYDGSTIAVDFVGHAYAILDTTPNIYEFLHIGLCNSSTECGHILNSDIIASAYKVPFVDGFATFKVQ